MGATGGSESNTKAFEEFYLEHRDKLFGTLCLISGDRFEAEEVAQEALLEVAQEALLRVWERWTSISILEDPEGYLYRVALNLLGSRRRRAALALRRIFGAAPRDDAFAAVDLHLTITAALRQVAPRQRLALVLTDLLDYSSAQAATLMGMGLPPCRLTPNL